LLVVARFDGIVRALMRFRERERAARLEAQWAERLLAEQNERLREADRMKDEFVAMISHDLRTPLTSIVGFLELALDEEEGPLTDGQRSYLEIVTRNSERLLHLVDDLLLAAELQAGELELVPTELDLTELVRESVEAARPQAESAGVELQLEAEPTPPVSGERGRLLQVLDNLISNAIKFTPNGGRVDVSVAPAGGTVRVAVRDTGIGIPPGEVERLFERFFRASTAVDQQIKGTGLGLYISRAIVGAHGGAISAESEVGVGTTFHVDLPVQVGRPVPSTAQASGGL
jgi:signal transduction histidine kinase